MRGRIEIRCALALFGALAAAPITLWGLAGLGLVASCSSGQGEEALLVGAASSVAATIEDLASEWTKTSGVAVQVTSASSSALARQIERGSPLDVFVSADQGWVEFLGTRGLINGDAVAPLAGNSLVLYARRNHGAAGSLQAGAKLRAGEALPPPLVGLRWATGNPDHVPVGRYSKVALQGLGWWAQIEPSLLPAADARAAVRLVELGEADFGVGYATDVSGPEWVTIPIDPGLHAPVRIMGVLLPDSSPGASSFLGFLAGPKAEPCWESAGFKVLAPVTNPSHSGGPPR